MSGLAAGNHTHLSSFLERAWSYKNWYFVENVKKIASILWKCVFFFLFRQSLIYYRLGCRAKDGFESESPIPASLPGAEITVCGATAPSLCGAGRWPRLCSEYPTNCATSSPVSSKILGIRFDACYIFLKGGIFLLFKSYMRQFISAVPFILTPFQWHLHYCSYCGNYRSGKHISHEHHVKTYDAVFPVVHFTFITSLNAPAGPAGVKSSISTHV